MTAGLLLASIGIAMILWALPAAHRLPPRAATAAAVGFAAGVALLMLGALLAAVPGFFGD